MHSIEVLSAGLLSTIQDSGRKHFRKYGVPVSGAMDKYSADLANVLLNNPDGTNVLEITLQGPTLQFNCNTCIAVTGADLSPKINDVSTDRNKVVEVRKGDILSFGKLLSGCRTYLAIKGGFEVDVVLGSTSYYPGICENILKKEMLISVQEHKLNVALNSSVKIDTENFSSDLIAVKKGPEFERLTPTQQELLFENSFLISPQNNRMGYQLTGNPIKLENTDMLTSITIPGTVQLTPAGNPIVLMRDCQTTGGYPRILQLTEKGINHLAQKKTSDHIRFQLI